MVLKIFCDKNGRNNVKMETENCVKKTLVVSEPTNYILLSRFQARFNECFQVHLIKGSTLEVGKLWKFICCGSKEQ